MPPVPPAHHFQANSPDREDLLPGLCVLGQRWVADVALGSFRGSQVRLEQWAVEAGGGGGGRAALLPETAGCVPCFKAEVPKAFPCLLPVANSVCYCSLIKWDAVHLLAQGTPFSLESWFAQDSVKCVPAAWAAGLVGRVSH